MANHTVTLEQGGEVQIIHRKSTSRPGISKYTVLTLTHENVHTYLAKKKAHGKQNRIRTKKEMHYNTILNPRQLTKLNSLLHINTIHATLIRRMYKDIFQEGLRSGQRRMKMYDPVPLIVVSGRYVQKYIGFDNCVILNHPRIDPETKKDIYYEINPSHIGKNVDKDLMNQFEKGIKVQKIPNKRLALITPKNAFLQAIKSLAIDFVDIELPCGGGTKCKSLKFKKDYILIMFASNEKVNNDSIHKWTPTFKTLVEFKMKKNLTGGSGKMDGKHFGSKGTYYGYGLIAKYNTLQTNKNISVYQFAGNESEEKMKQNIIAALRSDIEYMMSRSCRMLPNGLFAGFSVVSSIYKMMLSHPQQCKVLLDLFESEGVDDSKMCVSNWACKNAETLHFHQETDSSYTFLSVPMWDKAQLEQDGLELGTANFIFKWTNLESNASKPIYLPIKMDEGTSILFSGFGCYHRQHRTGIKKEFWNLASYQNRAFWQKLRNSVSRLVNDT